MMWIPAQGWENRSLTWDHSKPQPSNRTIISKGQNCTKVYIFLFKKLFHLDVRHTKEEKHCNFHIMDSLHFYFNLNMFTMLKSISLKTCKNCGEKKILSGHLHMTIELSIYSLRYKEFSWDTARTTRTDRHHDGTAASTPNWARVMVRHQTKWRGEENKTWTLSDMLLWEITCSSSHLSFSFSFK